MKGREGRVKNTKHFYTWYPHWSLHLKWSEVNCCDCVIRLTAPGRQGRSPQEEVCGSSTLGCWTKSPRRGQSRVGSANSSASLGPVGELDLLHHQHSPTPQKLTVGCCLFMFAGLLNTDFSRKFGKVIVMSLNLKWELLSLLDSMWKMEYVRLYFWPEHSQCACRASGSMVGLAKNICTYF